MEASELRKKSVVELKKELENSCKAFLSHRLQIAVQQSSDTAKLKELRRGIARIRTIISEQSVGNSSKKSS